MEHPFLTGVAVGAFLVAALTMWWYHFGGAETFAGWKRTLADKIREKLL